MSNLEEILEVIEPEYLLDDLGVDYKNTFGSSGRQLNVHECPVCGNSKWKVYLNEETGLGNCFRCDAKFNKFSFAQEVLAESPKATFEYLKNLAEVIGWQPKREKIEVEQPKKDLLDENLPASRALPIDGMNLVYLTERGIDIATASHYGLRYSENGTFEYEWNGGATKQDYSQRVIIPIYDLNGKLVSFQGRDITGRSPRKYLFPPGFASTGKYLFDGHNAIGAREIVIGEGVFDVMAIKLAMDQYDGRIKAVGTFGKSLSAVEGDAEDQLGQLLILKKHGLKTITFMWDGESSAIKAAVKAGEKIRTVGFNVRIAILPPGLDPNECTKEQVINAYRQAVTLNKLTAAKLLLSHN